MEKIYKNLTRYKSIIIYGEGKIGKEVLRYLQAFGLEEKIICFAVSKKKCDTYKVEGIDVQSIDMLQEYYNESLFLLAVSDRYMPEIIKVVKQKGIKHYLDAKVLYMESFQKNKLQILIRKVRKYLYCLGESKKFILGRKKKKAVHVTEYLPLNAGDTALSWCVRKFLNFDKWELREVRQGVNEGLLNEINSSDVLIVGGGGLFLPDTNANNISGWQWAISNEQIERIDTPMIIFAVGYNYFKGQENTEIFLKSLNCIVKKAEFVGLRNMGSVNAVKSMVEDELRDKIVYQPCITTLIRKIYKVKLVENSKRVVFNVAFDREERRFGENRELILEQIAKTASKIEKMGYTIMYVAHCDRDLDFLPYLEREKVKYEVKNLTQSLPNEIIKFYQKAAIVIGMRGHAQMIPFGMGVKIISLGSHDKMKWFLQDINMEECYIDLNIQCKTISERIMNIFEEVMINDPKRMEKKLWEEQEKLWNISCKNKEKIYEIVNKRESQN